MQTLDMQNDWLASANEPSLPDPIELADALWESVMSDGYEPALSTVKKDELDRRVIAHKANPTDVIPAGKVFADIRRQIAKDK